MGFWKEGGLTFLEVGSCGFRQVQRRHRRAVAQGAAWRLMRLPAQRVFWLSGGQRPTRHLTTQCSAGREDFCHGRRGIYKSRNSRPCFGRLSRCPCHVTDHVPLKGLSMCHAACSTCLLRQPGFWAAQPRASGRML